MKRVCRLQKKLEMKHGIRDKCNNFMPKTSNNLKSLKKAMKHGIYSKYHKTYKNIKVSMTH